MLAYQAARAVWPELAILDPIAGGVTLLLVAHQVSPKVISWWLKIPHGAPIHNVGICSKGSEVRLMSMFYRVLPTSLHDWLAPRRLRRFRPLRLDRANCWLQAFILNCWVQSGQMHRVDAFLVPGIFNLPVSWRQLVMAVAVRCNQQFQVDQVGSKMFQGIFAFARGQPGADFYRLIVLVPAPFAEDWQIWRSSRGLRRGGKSCAVDMMPGQSVESQQWRRWVTMGHLAPLCDKFCLYNVNAQRRIQCMMAKGHVSPTMPQKQSYTMMPNHTL